jgi:class 3 adenylate cyclase
MTCSTCGTENPAGARFCSNCGAPLQDTCVNCGAALAADARFCQACGQPVAPASDAEERKLVTVLFADVTGSTALGERLDPERLKEVMGAYFAAMRDEIEAQEGTVEKFIGDAVMAVFGVPVAHEDDPARSLRAALRMRERLGALNGDLANRFALALEMRIGVNTGEVLAVAEPKPGEGMVSGDAVNVAARLEQAAEPGQVLVGERTVRASRGFAFAEMPPLELKGKGRPVAAFRLLGESLERDRGVPGLRAPLVGRDREMGVLQSVFERVADERRPHLVTIYGEAGVGKSRLTSEFLSWAEARDPAPHVVRGRCLPYGEGITYWPVAEILKGEAGMLDTDPPEVALEKIRKVALGLLTEDIAPDALRAAAALAYTVGVEDPEIPFRNLPPRQVQIEAQAAWRSFFSALAAAAPLVVVVEDIHWADPAMLDLLEDLSDRVRGPALFLCPSRPDLTARRSAWGGGRRNFSSVALDPLSEDDADRLVSLLLSVEELPQDVHRRILERAEGNPFFLEEIIRQLIDEGRIERAGDRWRAVSGIEGVSIPDTIQGVLAARIDLLEAGDKRALQSAAVVGRIFWAGPVAALLNGAGHSLDEVFDRLEGRELVLARLGSSMAGEREYIFKHVLIRDVAYESLPRRDRAGAHTRVARWIEDALGERAREFSELLGYHYDQAHRGAAADPTADRDEIEDLRTRALGHLLAASEDARSKMALSKAQTVAEQAIGLAQSTRERALAEEAAGLAYLLDYRGSDAWRHLSEATEHALAMEPPDPELVARTACRAVEVPTRWPGSMWERPEETAVRRLLDEGLAAAPEGDSEVKVRLLTAVSMWPFGFPDEAGTEADRERGLQAGREAADMARRMSRPDLESGALDGMESYYMVQGLYGVHYPGKHRRLELVDGLADPLEIGDAFAMSSGTELATGNYHRAFGLADEGFRRTEDEMPAAALHNVAWRAQVRFRLGDWDGVLADVERAQDLLGERRDQPPYFAVGAFAAAQFVHQSRGDLGPADRLHDMLTGQLGGRGRMPQGLIAWMVLCDGRRGDFERARRHLESPVWVETFHGSRYLLYECRSTVLAWEMAWDDVPQFLEECREHAERAELVALPAFADRLEGRAAWARGDGVRAEELLTRAGETFRRLEARWEAALSDLWLAEARLDRAGSADVQGPLERARSVFEDLGSLPELEQVRRLSSGLG